MVETFKSFTLDTELEDLHSSIFSEVESFVHDFFTISPFLSFEFVMYIHTLEYMLEEYDFLSDFTGCHI